MPFPQPLAYLLPVALALALGAATLAWPRVMGAGIMLLSLAFYGWAISMNRRRVRALADTRRPLPDAIYCRLRTKEPSMPFRQRVLAIAIALAAAVAVLRPAPISAQAPPAVPSRLAVIWTSADPDVAKRVCFMYTHAAKKQKWFDEVTLIVWGPSARLLAGDKDLQAEVKTMAADGVVVVACQACADSYGVTPQLRALGLDVKFMGKPLTDMLKSDWKVLTF